MAFNTNRSFASVLPSMNLNYRFSKTENLNISYRASNTAPTITQLQDVLDVSNPLQVTTGNANLKQTYDHTLRMRFGKTNRLTQRNFFVFATATYTQNYISNATLIPAADTTFQGYTLSAGSTLTRPVNLNNYYTLRSNAVYSLPLEGLKSNLNLNGGISYTHTPALINNVLNYSGSVTPNAGFTLGSNISQYVDFTVAYNGSYNVVKNSTQTTSDNSYYSHTASAKLNLILWKGLVLNTDLTNTMYRGLTASYNQSYFLWNAYIGYKFLKDHSLEAKVAVYDILNQNRSISRTITEAYTQDTRTSVLKRYGMLTLTYTLRHFKNGSSQPDSKMPDDRPPGPPPGGGPGGPGGGGPGGPPPGM